MRLSSLWIGYGKHISVASFTLLFHAFCAGMQSHGVVFVIQLNSAFKLSIFTIKQRRA